MSLCAFLTLSSSILHIDPVRPGLSHPLELVAPTRNLERLKLVWTRFVSHEFSALATPTTANNDTRELSATFKISG